MVDDTWRIDVDLLDDAPEAENAAKYWAGRPSAAGKITWQYKSSELFGVATPQEAAKLAAQFVVATFIGAPCPDCGQPPEGVVVLSRGALSAKKSDREGAVCSACQETRAVETKQHQDRISQWAGSFNGALPDELENLSEILLLDKFTQSTPFKDGLLRGALLMKAGFSTTEIGQLLGLGIIYPASVRQPENIEFNDEGVRYYPYEVDWNPSGEGPQDDRFAAIGKLASLELHGAVAKFPQEFETMARKLVIWEAERYLVHQLSDRDIDDPTEAQLTRFRESVIETWASHSLGEIYSAIWQGCARAGDNKTRNRRMGSDAVTGSAVNTIVKTLSEYRSGERGAKAWTQPYDLPLSSETVSVFRIALDLDPLAALEAEVAEALGTEARPLPATEEILEEARRVYAACLESMPEEHAVTATMVSLGLLLRYYDVETVNAARAAFASERLASRFATLDAD